MGSGVHMRSRLKGLVKAGLRSVGPSPELALEIARTRAELEALSQQVARLAVAADPRGVVADDDIESSEFLRSEVSRLSQLVAGILDRVHSHQEQLDQLRQALERFGGAALEGTALERRLATIEDHLAIGAQQGDESA